MTGAEYLAALERLGLTNAQLGAFLDVDRATAWRWRADGPPAPVAKLLAVMVVRKLTVAKVDDLEMRARRSLNWQMIRRKAID